MEKFETAPLKVTFRANNSSRDPPPSFVPLPLRALLPEHLAYSMLQTCCTEFVGAIESWRKCLILLARRLQRASRIKGLRLRPLCPLYQWLKPWLGDVDSNHDKRSQSPLSYR